MANIASNIHDRGEFWRPPLETRQEASTAVQAQSCVQCGTEFVAGSRFCHMCGTARDPQLSAPRVQWRRWLNPYGIRERLGLPWPSLLALLAGIVCTLAAVGTGLLYTASTMLDWQAVQLWRIEWLLAAMAAFLAGILLRSSASKHAQD